MQEIKKLWRGEVPLVYTFWIWGVLVGVLLRITTLVIEYNCFRIFQTYGRLPTYALLIAQLTYFLFICAAIWRSADRYSGSKHWVNAAKVIIFLSVGSFAVGVTDCFESFTKGIENQLQKTANLLNKSLPTMVDEVTKLNRVSAEKNQFTYHYQIVDMSVSAMNAEAFSKRIQPLIKRGACTAEDMKKFIQDGVSLAYSYTGSNNEELTQIVITPADCGY